MANWNTLKRAVADVINTNGNQAITGQLLQNVLNNIITNVGENATFVDVATPEINPGAPDGPVFYLATTAGTYPNFNGIEVQDGESAVLHWATNGWEKKIIGYTKSTIINGDIINYADEEDITAENNLLKLKNRSNYVILRKNKTFAAQVNTPNTIYEVRYVFNLNDEEVTIPEGCTLKFEGGKLLNGTLIGSDTNIESPLIHIFQNIVLSGNFCKEFFIEWFGARSGGVTNNETAINYAIEQVSNTQGGGTLVFTRDYIVNGTIFMRPRVSYRGVTNSSRTWDSNQWHGSSIKFNFDDNPYKWVFDIKNEGEAPLSYNQLDTNSFTDSTHYMSDTGFEKLAIFNIGEKWAFGGIRHRRLHQHGFSDLVIEGVYIGIAVSYAWCFKFDNVRLSVNRYGIYFGDMVTSVSINEIYMSRVDTLNSNSTVVSIIPNFNDIIYLHPTEMNIPYTSDVKSVGIIAESGVISINDCTIELFDAVSKLYNGVMIFNNTYLEQIKQTISYTYSGTVIFNPLKVTSQFYLTQSYEFGIGHENGFIEAHNIPTCRCWYNAPNLHRPFVKTSRSKPVLYYDSIKQEGDNYIGELLQYPRSRLLPDVSIGSERHYASNGLPYLDSRFTTGVGTTPLELDELLSRPEYTNIRCFVIDNDTPLRSNGIVVNKHLSFYRANDSLGAFVQSDFRIRNCVLEFENILSPQDGIIIYGDSTIIYKKAAFWGTAFVLAGLGNYTLHVYCPDSHSLKWSTVEGLIANPNFSSPYKVIVDTVSNAEDFHYEFTNPTRPTTNIPKGYEYFDTNLNKPIWWTGSDWVDAAGTTV